MLRWALVRLTGSVWGTAAVNLIGCLLMGLLAGWLVRHGGNEPARLLLGVGLLGGFTTMSAFALDSVDLWSRSPVGALLYAGVTIIGSLVAVTAGILLTR